MFKVIKFLLLWNILQTLNILCLKIWHVHEIYNQYDDTFLAATV